MSEAAGPDACAIGNILANARVPAAMLRRSRPNRPRRWPNGYVALEEGLAAGGEQGPVRSAHLVVVDTESFPLVDLRSIGTTTDRRTARIVEPLCAGHGDVYAARPGPGRSTEPN